MVKKELCLYVALLIAVSMATAAPVISGRNHRIVDNISYKPKGGLWWPVRPELALANKTQTNCPWFMVIDEDVNRYPELLERARCLTKNTPDQQADCEVITYDVLVKFRLPGSTFEERKISIEVGCACVPLPPPLIG